MKNWSIVVVACSLLLASFPSHAQGISLGIRAGWNWSNLDVTNSNRSGGSGNGPVAGIYAAKNFNDKIALQGELFFSQTTYNIDLGLYPSNDGKIKNGLVSLPLYFRYQPVKFIHLLVGPQFNFLASSTATQGPVSADFKSNFNALEVGASAGVGFDFGPFNVGARYFRGLSNLDPSSDGATVKSNGFQLVAGYRLISR